MLLKVIVEVPWMLLGLLVLQFFIPSRKEYDWLCWCYPCIPPPFSSFFPGRTSSEVRQRCHHTGQGSSEPAALSGQQPADPSAAPFCQAGRQEGEPVPSDLQPPAPRHWHSCTDTARRGCAPWGQLGVWGTAGCFTRGEWGCPWEFRLLWEIPAVWYSTRRGDGGRFQWNHCKPTGQLWTECAWSTLVLLLSGTCGHTAVGVHLHS